MTTVTREDISECREATQALRDAIDQYKADYARYQELQTEYQRRLSAYRAEQQFASTYCTGACENGGPTCNPRCRNIRKFLIEPIAPSAFVPPNFGNFVCTICQQNVNIDAQTGGDVNVASDAINQQMQCTALAETALDAASEGTSTLGENKTTSDGATTSTENAKKKKAIVIAMSMILIFIIIIAIVIGIILSSRKKTADVGAR